MLFDLHSLSVSTEMQPSLASSGLYGRTAGRVLLSAQGPSDSPRDRVPIAGREGPSDSVATTTATTV
jgi:hypothetical protein